MPRLKPATRSHALAYFCLGVLFLFSIAHFVRDGFGVFDVVQHANEYVRDPFELNLPAVATSLRPEAEAGGLRDQDVVLAVNDRPLDGFVVYYGALLRARMGDRLQVKVQSTGPNGPVVRDLSIALRPEADNPDFQRSRASLYAGVALSNIVMPLLCVGLGFWVAAVRIGDRAAWLLLTVLLSLAAFNANATLFGHEDFFQPLSTGFHVFFANIAAAALMLFGIIFPERLDLDRRFPWLKWLIAGPLIVAVTAVAIMYGLAVDHVALALDVKRARAVMPGWMLGAPVHFIAVVVCFASLGYKAATASSRDARRRLLLLDVAAVASVAALVFLLVMNRRDVLLPSWVLLFVLATVLVFPLAMAYVIVVHRAMDVSVVIRQGLQYLLARNGILVMQVGIAVAIVVLAATMSSGSSVGQRVLLFSIGLALIACVRMFAQRLSGWIDRLFFREAYKADAILTELAGKVRSIVETNSLLETVATRIAESLHVPRVAILLNQGGAFRPAYALGYGGGVDAAIAPEGVIVRRLRKQQHALVNFEDADSWVQLADDQERSSLEQLNSELLLPISLNEQVLGIMSLSTKQSEEAFSMTDIRLLDSVAAQTGLALENGRLTQAIAAEVAEREKHKRELEIAHEVQERLFPQEYPPVAGIDYAGACRPALGVGGDYYDFVPLPESRLGIAVGDVSGKGIPAALLMATLRACLRAEMKHPESDLTVVMANLNELVYESSEAHRYATFFYAEFDAASRTLKYVNAGHNPPMVFRRSDGGQQVVRLDAGGPVIGMMEGLAYSQGSVTLERGDVFVAYTDGISEAMNAADEEWGEERLMRAVRANRTTTAAALIEKIMAAADAFVAGAPQHDDMTLLVVQVI